MLGETSRPLRVRDVMSSEVLTVAPDWSLQEIACLMRDGNIGAVPVAEGERLVGIITDRDLVLRGLAEDPGAAHTRQASDVMSPHLYYCFDDQGVEDALRSMGEQQVRRLPVVDRNKKLVGMVSLCDLSRSAEVGFGGAALQRLSRPGLH